MVVSLESDLEEIEKEKVAQNKRVRLEDTFLPKHKRVLNESLVEGLRCECRKMYSVRNARQKFVLLVKGSR